MFEAAVQQLDEVDARVDPGDRVRELQDRIRSMQRTRLDTRALPTIPALGELLPDGALAAGNAYSVDGSTTLALGLLLGPSRAGSWCAVVGMPDLGVEAAAGLGLDLERLVLVPYPGAHWLSVVSALVDVVSVVLVRPPSRSTGGASSRVGDAAASVPLRVGDAAASKLASRLRQREAVLVSLGDGADTAWPRSEAQLRVTESAWVGLGSGFGHLAARQVTVSSTSRSWAGRSKSRRLWLPGPDQAIEPVVARAAAPLPDGTGHDTAERPALSIVG